MAEPSKSSARILVADDNPQGAELIEAYLEDTGWQVQIVNDGTEALRQVNEWHPDVVLLDVMMPRLSGFEVCKKVKSEPATNSIPVLMITALDQASDVDKAVEAGTNDFLTKPINKTDLVLRVKALLSSRQCQTDLDRAIMYVNSLTQISA